MGYRCRICGQFFRHLESLIDHFAHTLSKGSHFKACSDVIVKREKEIRKRGYTTQSTKPKVPKIKEWQKPEYRT